jgi:hypothetical protein
MKLDHNLHLVIPFDGDDGKRFYIHSATIGRHVFEENFIVLGKAFSRLYSEGMGDVSGPRFGALMIRQCANDMGIEDEVERGLINEIRRLTNVIIRTDKGWETITLTTCMERKLLSEDDFAEVEGAICFFILASSVHKKSVRELFLKVPLQIWGGEITYLNATEYRTSLPTSITEKTIPSSPATQNPTAPGAGDIATATKESRIAC